MSSETWLRKGFPVLFAAASLSSVSCLCRHLGRCDLNRHAMVNLPRQDGQVTWHYTSVGIPLARRALDAFRKAGKAQYEKNHVVEGSWPLSGLEMPAQRRRLSLSDWPTPKPNNPHVNTLSTTFRILAAKVDGFKVDGFCAIMAHYIRR